LARHEYAGQVVGERQRLRISVGTLGDVDGDAANGAFMLPKYRQMRPTLTFASMSMQSAVKAVLVHEVCRGGEDLAAGARVPLGVPFACLTSIVVSVIAAALRTHPGNESRFIVAARPARTCTRR